MIIHVVSEYQESIYFFFPATNLPFDRKEGNKSIMTGFAKFKVSSIPRTQASVEYRMWNVDSSMTFWQDLQ